MSTLLTFEQRLERLRSLSASDELSLEKARLKSDPLFRETLVTLKGDLLTKYGGEMIACALSLRNELTGNRDLSTEQRSREVSNKGKELAKTCIDAGLNEPDQFEGLLHTMVLGMPDLFKNRVCNAIEPAFDDTCWLTLSAVNVMVKKSDNRQLGADPGYQAYCIPRSVGLPKEWGRIGAGWHPRVLSAMSHETGTIHMSFLEQVLSTDNIPVVDFTAQTKEALARYRSHTHGCPAHVEPSSGTWPNMQYEFWDHLTHAILA